MFKITEIQIPLDSFLPNKVNFDGIDGPLCVKGSKFDILFVFVEKNTQIDLVNYSIKMQIKESFGSSNVFASLSVNTLLPNTNLDPIDSILISLSSADTSVFEPGTYLYDLDVIDTDNEKTTVVRGEFHVIDKVTEY